MAQGKIRVKEFEHDGVKCKFGAITVKQMRELEDKNRQVKLGDVLLVSLRNGEPEFEWTPDKIDEEFDLQTFNAFIEDCRAFNGLRTDPVKQGEAKAAESESSNSVAE